MARADMESASPVRQSLQAASEQLPAELSASSGVGVTLGAMMGDQSLGKARRIGDGGTASSGRQSERCASDLFCKRAVPYGSPSRSVA